MRGEGDLDAAPALARGVILQRLRQRQRSLGARVCRDRKSSNRRADGRAECRPLVRPRQPSGKESNGFAAPLQDQVMEAMAAGRVVGEKAQIVEQRPVCRLGEELRPRRLVGFRQRLDSDRIGRHVHFAMLRQRALISPTVAVGSPRVLTVSSRLISKVRIPRPDLRLARSLSVSW